MKIKKIHNVFFVLIIMIFGLFITDSSLSAPKVLVWGSASLGSDGYQIIEVLVSIANKYINDFINTSVSTAGGAENLVLISQGVIQLGQTTSSDLYNAYHGVGPYSKPIQFAQLFAYGAWPLPICVPVESDIHKVEDLVGKKLAVGPAGGAAVPMMTQLFEEYGILDKVEFVYGSWSECAQSFQTKRVDAVTINHLGGVMLQAAFAEVAVVRPFRPILIDENKMKSVASKNEGITISTVYAAPFKNYEFDTKALGISGVLTATPDLDEEAAYQITKSILENAEEVRSYGPRMSLVNKEWAIEGLVSSYPVHPGAARYFKEVGIWADYLRIYGD